ncbi:MAG: hypothetical protein RR595_03945 [Lysinibacillus sp.]
MELVTFDKKTGEIKEDIAYYRTLKQQEAWIKQQQREKAIEKGRDEPHVGCFQDPIKEVTPHLTLTQCGALIKLLLHMKMSNGGLLMKNKVPLTLTDIQQILGKGRTQTSAIVKKLESLSMINSPKAGRPKHFYMNEKYHVMGTHPKGKGKRHFIKLYKAKLGGMVDDLTLEELGFLYKILPYCHYHSFYLVHNPNEGDFAKIEHMNRDELATAINYNVDNVTALVKQLRKKGLLISSNSSGVVLYRVHPHLIHIQGDGSDSRIKGVCAEFEAHQNEANRRSKRVRD